MTRTCLEHRPTPNVTAGGCDPRDMGGHGTQGHRAPPWNVLAARLSLVTQESHRWAFARQVIKRTWWSRAEARGGGRETGRPGIREVDVPTCGLRHRPPWGRWTVTPRYTRASRVRLRLPWVRRWRVCLRPSGPGPALLSPRARSGGPSGAGPGWRCPGSRIPLDLVVTVPLGKCGESHLRPAGSRAACPVREGT